MRGLIAALRGNPEEALPELRRAHDLWPGDANVIGELCRFSITAGVPTIETLVNHLVEIDPLTAVSHLVVSLFNCVNGRYDRVGAASRRASALCADDSALHLFSAWYLAEAGHREEASDLLGRTTTALSGTPLAEWALVLKCALDSDFPGALRHFTADVEGVIQSETGAKFMADVFALMGRRKDALRWLRVAIARGYTSYPSLAVHDPFLEDLRSDEEFEALMAELELRWEALVASAGGA